MTMLKLCNCGQPIDILKRKCESCMAKKNERHQMYDKYRRDKEAASFYKSKPWRVLREQALLRDLGLCQHCLAKDKITLADMVDHIIPIKEAWELRLVLDNLQSLCNSCHAAKTSEDKKKYK
ncbi:HNH endonuclease [Cytobacillus oceanisediminis]|uniref:HNH endonuclease n=1 Tax=Cytobacillus oceanisediminis TaxID=665099 RepID=UPI001C23CD49|nr:HNH endonuclease [Cytobacillus oceanisediminis]MBU8733446.1 HNH endonuclease [Cytobacillus oceanisediminis]